MQVFAATPPPPLLKRSPSSVNPANVTWNIESQQYAPAAEQLQFQVMPAKNSQNVSSSTHGSFILRKVKLIGVSGAVPVEVTAVYTRALNKPAHLSDLLAIAANMQSAYRALGFILVRVVVPPQEIDLKQGEVTFQVIEGQIQKVIFTGEDPQAAKAQLQRYANAIENESPTTYQTLDHFLNLANSLPGIHVSATLVPDKTVVGGSDLIMNVQETGQSAFLNFNNYGTSYIGPGQGLVGAAIYDIFGADSLSVTGSTSTSNPNQLEYLSGSYDLITGPYGTEINPIFSYTETRPGGNLTVFDMLGASSKYTLNVNQPLIASRTQNLTFNSSIYHLNSYNNVFQTVQLYDDKITALTGGLSYQGIFLQSQNTMDVYTTLGLPIFGTPATLSNPSRLNGETEFIMLNFDTSTTHYLTQRVSFNLATTGQITPEPLLVSEQLGYGGMLFGQGFTPYVISGDNGLFGNFALRYDLSSFRAINVLQPEVFYNAGMVANNQAENGTVEGASAESAGIGLNLVLFNEIQMNMVLAKPLRLTQITNPGSNDWQAFINLTAVF